MDQTGNLGTNEVGEKENPIANGPTMRARQRRHS
jgi:hypothetical protein